MRTLYFDCFAGASGNMILGALIGLGVDRDRLVENLKLLDIPDFDIEITNVDRSGISAVHADVKVPDEKTHRHLHHIEKIISDSSLADRVKERAIAIFTRLAEAEARIHGIDVKSVHFHEVGALDAIIDVVGACIGFDILGIEKFACSKIHVGSGFAEMAHGKFPIPPPAVAELLRNAPIYSTETEGELITPTGAAIISTICDSYGMIPGIVVEETAYGAGTREYERFPNVLRLIVGEYEPQRSEDSELITKESLLKQGQRSTNNELLTLVETNIDDLSPQILGFVMERAFELGALDCWFTPIQMKKNRPATMISILSEKKDQAAMTALLYSETTTLGVRVREVERECLPREIIKVQTEFGEVDVKIGRYEGRTVNAMPEYEQIKRLALENNVPFRTVSDAVLIALKLPRSAFRA